MVEDAIGDEEEDGVKTQLVEFVANDIMYRVVQKILACLNFPPSSHPLTQGCQCTAHQP